MSRSDSAAPPVFKSPEGEARYLRAYDAVVRIRPVPHEELDVPTRFGSTHLIASGPPDAPPLLLLPSLAGSATLWRPNVARLSRRHRVCAVDGIGQVGKSVPTRRPRTRGDFADWLVDVLDALGVERASLVAAWGELMKVTMAEYGRPSLTPPVVLPEAEVRAIRAPTLLLIGETEILYDAERTLRHARKRMPNLTGAVVPGAHHLAALACLDGVDARILEFLDGARSDASRSA